MPRTILNGSVDVWVGDCSESLRAMEAASVDAVITSPPYFGLRSYTDDAKEVGREETVAEYVQRLVDIFAEVHRVLKPAGVLWLNLGDSYNGSGGAGGDYGPGGCREGQSKYGRRSLTESGLKPKDLVGAPWRVALALQAWGWYLRSEVIWSKPNPMPSSVLDRPVVSHETVFMLSKSRHYHFDAAAYAERCSAVSDNRRPYQREANGEASSASNGVERGGERGRGVLPKGMRNRRSVWSIPTASYSESHFAVFPPALVEPMLLASCPPGGVVLDPFGGSGTTAGVALKHSRRAVLCELSPEYADLMPSRIESISRLTEGQTNLQHWGVEN